MRQASAPARGRRSEVGKLAVGVRTCRRGPETSSACRAVRRRAAASRRSRPEAAGSARGDSRTAGGRAGRWKGGRLSPSLPVKIGRLAEQLAKLLAHAADRERFRPGDVDDERRRGGMAQRLQRHGVGVALPDDVDGAHRQVDRLARQNLPGQIDEHAVAQLAGVVQPHDRQPRAAGAAEIVVQPFAADAARGVFADGRERIGFERAAVRDGRQRIDVAGRERGDPAAGDSAGRCWPASSS